jgi:hypothetical protein
MIQEIPTTLIRRVGGAAIVVCGDNSQFVGIVVADLVIYVINKQLVLLGAKGHNI